LVAALSACAAQPRSGATPADTAATAPQAAPATAPEPEKAAPVPAPAKEQKQIARLPESALDAAPATRVYPVPIARHLMGRSPDGVTETLGAPSFQRKEPPAEVWQYRGERCILDVFFMPKDGALAVTHVTIRGYGVAKIAEPDCLADLAAERNPAKPG
jgi:hypothetical protein